MTEKTENRLTSEQISALIRSTFGAGAAPLSISELPGGMLNETWLLELSGYGKVVLRVAPPESEDTYWDEAALMRREVSILPAFAPVSSLMPGLLFADFTGRLIPRDYMLQSFLPGQRWSDLEPTLAPEKNLLLWREFGQITARIHAVQGSAFGYPTPGQQFGRWRSVILDRFDRLALDFERHALDVPAFNLIRQAAVERAELLDEITLPHLLHGDLWTFNVLVDGDVPRITGILDADRAWWGDPQADWGMFLLALRRDDPAWQERLAAFDSGYALTHPEAQPRPAAQRTAAQRTADQRTARQLQPVLPGLHATQTPRTPSSTPVSGDRFRMEVYKALHVAVSVVYGARHGKPDLVSRGRQDLVVIAGKLETLEAL